MGSVGPSKISSSASLFIPLLSRPDQRSQNTFEKFEELICFAARLGLYLGMGLRLTPQQKETDMAKQLRMNPVSISRFTFNKETGVFSAERSDLGSMTYSRIYEDSADMG